RSSLRTYKDVFAIGFPIGTLCWRGSCTRYMEDQIVVSVGPYMFQTGPQLAASLRANSVGAASPPTRTFSPGSPFHPHSKSRRQEVGVACKTVALDCASSFSSR